MKKCCKSEVENIIRKISGFQPKAMCKSSWFIGKYKDCHDYKVDSVEQEFVRWKCKFCGKFFIEDVID